MKKIIVAILLVALFAACKKKPEPDIIIVPKTEKAKPKGPVRMQSSSADREFTWLGRKYHCIINRQPSDSLPMVKDADGQQFVDNRISLKIKRDDGSTFFARSFTKKSFDSYLDANFSRGGILEGLVFDEVDDDHVKLAASVSLPQSDEYIPLVVTIDRFGGITIRRDTSLDIALTEDDVEV